MLRRNYQEQTTQLFGQYINMLLQQYAANPQAAWQAKDVAIFLLTALTVTTFRRNAGTTTINPLVPLVLPLLRIYNCVFQMANEAKRNGIT